MTAATTAPPPLASKSLAARIVGVLVSPRATYADVAAHPRWLGVLLFIVVVGAGSLYTFLATDVGKNASFDQRIHMMESFGAKINDQTYARMEQTADQAKYFGAAGQAVTLPVIALIIAAIAFAIF